MALGTTGLPLLKKKMKVTSTPIPQDIIKNVGPKPKGATSGGELPNVVTPEVQQNIDPLITRLTNANIPPYQPGMSIELSNQLATIYRNQANQKALELLPQRQQMLKEQQALQRLPIAEQVGQLTPEQIAVAQAANPETSFQESVRGANPDILAAGVQGAALGAGAGVIGAGATAGLSIPIAAAGGALLNILKASLSELKEEEQQGVANQYAEFTNARDDLSKIINSVHAGEDPIVAQALFNHVLAKIDRTESNLKLLEERDWLSKGKRRLTAVQSFNDLERNALIRKMQIAILNPDPSKITQITPADITGETE